MTTVHTIEENTNLWIMYSQPRKSFLFNYEIIAAGKKFSNQFNTRATTLDILCPLNKEFRKKF